jgi:hypothetical protein
VQCVLCHERILHTTAMYLAALACRSCIAHEVLAFRAHVYQRVLFTSCVCVCLCLADDQRRCKAEPQHVHCSYQDVLWHWQYCAGSSTVSQHCHYTCILRSKAYCSLLCIAIRHSFALASVLALVSCIASPHYLKPLSASSCALITRCVS